MKKQLFLTAMTALVMVSCSEENVLDTNKGNAIDFRAAMGTRAQETNTANMSSIYVTALDARNENLFSDQLFSKSGNFFTSTPAYYWPGDGSTLTFYAYSPSKTDLGGTLTITSATKKLTDFSPATDISNQKDFVTIKATGNKTNETSGVQLQFEHRLVQIEVKAKNTNEGYQYKVKGVRIGMPVSKGTFDFDANTWTLNSEKTNYEVTYETERMLNGMPASIMKTDDDNAMLIPQQLTAWATATDKTNVAKGAYLAVKVKITTKAGAHVYPVANGGDYDWVAVPIETNWVAGNKYVYTLDFSNGAGKVDPEKVVDPDDNYQPGDDILGGAIKFTVNVTDWTEQAENINM